MKHNSKLFNILYNTKSKIQNHPDIGDSEFRTFANYESVYLSKKKKKTNLTPAPPSPPLILASTRKLVMNHFNTKKK